jgi:hypothetical protein
VLAPNESIPKSNVINRALDFIIVVF